MTDHVLAGFLERQREDGLALAAQSDLVTLVPLPGTPTQRYLLQLRCKGLVRTSTGEIAEADRFLLGIWFPDDYLRRADPFRVLTWLGPSNAFHPNVRPPFACIGRLVARTPLVDIIYRAFEVVTYRRVTMQEDDALNHDACVWARRNQHHFPVDARPLKRAAARFRVVPVEREP
jgi:hypothetical protein